MFLDASEALEERFIGLYFVENLMGNGLTDWVLDDEGRVYTYMILDPAAFQSTLTELLTARAKSAFKGAPDLRVEAGHRRHRGPEPSQGLHRFLGFRPVSLGTVVGIPNNAVDPHAPLNRVLHFLFKIQIIVLLTQCSHIQNYKHIYICYRTNLDR